MLLLDDTAAETASDAAVPQPGIRTNREAFV
jgi:hypothetical protein